MAIYIGNQQITEFLISNGANLNFIDSKEWTPITRTIEEGNQEIMKLLSKHGANLNAIVEGSHSPLNKAISMENYKFVEFLIENGADVNMVDGLKWPPVIYAIFKREKGNCEVTSAKWCRSKLVPPFIPFDQSNS